MKTTEFDIPRGNPAFRQGDEDAWHLACDCGCDNRNDPTLVGYHLVIKDGHAVRTDYNDPDEFIVALEAAGADVENLS